MNDLTQPGLAGIDIDAVHAAPGHEVDPLDDKWPQRLAEWVDVLAADAERRGAGIDEAIRSAQRAVLLIANHEGGRQVYLPRGEALRLALRDREIFLRSSACGGRNKDALAREHGLSTRAIEVINARQYQLGIARRQGRLPFAPETR